MVKPDRDTAVAFHCLFVPVRQLKSFATTEELALFKTPPQKHIIFLCCNIYTET